MILFPPVSFDGNEWFIIVNIVIMLSGVILFPKRLSFLTSLVVCLFTFYLAQLVDAILGKPPLLLYYNGDIVEYEYFDIILYLISFPLFAYFFCYYLDKWTLKGRGFFVYVISWSLFTTVLEWVAVKFFHVFTWTGWRTSYSFISYVIIYSLIIVVFRFVQHYQKQ